MMNFQQETKNLIAQFVGQPNVLTIPRPLLRYMNDDANGGLFLSQLLYWSSRTSNKEGWFYKTYAEWKEELGLSEHQARKVINILKKEITDKKIIEDLKEKGIEELVILETKVKKANTNPTVHYRLNFEVFSVSFLAFLSNETEHTEEGSLKKRVREPKKAEKDTQNNEVPITETTTKTTSETTTKITNTQSGVCPKDGFAFDEEDTDNKELSFAEVSTNKLHLALLQKRKLPIKPNLKKWIKQIDSYIHESIITKDEFTDVLDWYVLHIGEQYIPKAHCAKTFCDRFINLQDAMSRSNSPSKNELSTFDNLMQYIEEKEKKGELSL